MADNQMGAQYLTSLDVDISKLEKTLNDLNAEFEKSAKNANSHFQNVFNFSGIDNAIGDAKEIDREFSGIFQDLSKKTSLLFPKSQLSNLDDAKTKLFDILATTGEISKIEWITKKDTDEIQRAKVLMKDFNGREVSESFKLVEKDIGEVVDGVQQYNLVWEQTGDRKYIDNIELRNKAMLKESETAKKIAVQEEKRRQNLTSMYTGLFDKIEKQERSENKLYKSQVERLDKLIIKQQQFTKTQEIKKRPDTYLVNQSKELEEQLKVIRQQLIAKKNLTEEEIDYLSQLKKSSGELKTQAIVPSAISPRPQGNAFSNLMVGAGFRAFQLAEDGARKTIETLKDVEFSVMEITRVLNDSSLNVQQYTSDIYDLALNYGNRFEDASEVTKRFAQAGYDASDSLALMEKTLLALNTAELSMEQSTQSLIGIMQQWGIDAEQYGLLIDKINITADNFAVTSQDLVDGLLRSGAAAKNAKFTFDETLGALVAMREASGRTGREVGNAFNSLLSYLSKASTIDVFENLGIKVWADESRTSMMPLLDIWGQLSERMVKTDADGNRLVYDLERLTDMSTLMSEEVAMATNSLDEYNQAMEIQNKLQDENLSEQERQEVFVQAGTHRRNYFMALLTNFNRIQEVTTNLQNAEGYSLQENARYMETLTAKYNQFITSLEQLAVQAGDEGLLDIAKASLDTATAFNNLIKNTGGVNNAMRSLFGLLLLIKQNWVVATFSSLGNSMSLVALYSIDLFNGLRKADKALIQTSASALGLTKVNLAGWIGIAITALSLLTAGVSAYNAKQKEMREESIKTGREAGEQAESILKLANEYNKLYDIQKKTEEQTEQLNAVGEKLNDILGERSNRLNDLTIGTKAYNEELYNQIQAELESKRVELTGARVSAQEEVLSATKTKNMLGFEVFDMFIRYSDLAKKHLEDYEIAVYDVLEQFKSVSISSENDVSVFTPKDKDINSILEWYEGLIDAKKTLEDTALAQGKVALSIALSSPLYKELNENINRLGEPIDQYIAILTQEEVAHKGVSRAIFEDNEAYKSYRDEIIKTANLGDYFTKQIEDAVDAFLNLSYVVPMAKDEIAEMAKWQSNLSFLLSEDKVKYGELDDQIKSVTQSTNNLKSAFSILSKAQEEWNANGELSIATLLEMLTLEPQYLQLLIDENGQFNYNIEAIKNLTLSKIDEMEVSQLRKFLDLISTIKSETDAINILSGVTTNSANATKEYNERIIEQIYLMEQSGIIASGTSKRLVDYANSISGIYDKTREQVKSNKFSLDMFEGGGSKSGAGTAKSWYESQVESFERLNRMGQKTTQQTVDFYKSMANSGKLSAEERIKAEDKLFSAIKENIKQTTQAQIDALNKRKTEIQDRATEEIASLQKVEKENDRLRAKEEYLRSRSEISGDISRAESRSGIEARREEEEGKKRLEELDRQYKEKLEGFNLQDAIDEINRMKDEQIESIDSQIENLNKKIEENTLNSLAFYGTFGDDAFNVLATGFIEPVANGFVYAMYEAYSQIEEMTEESSNIIYSTMKQRLDLINSDIASSLNQLKIFNDLSSGSFRNMQFGNINPKTGGVFPQNNTANYSYNNSRSFSYSSSNKPRSYDDTLAKKTAENTYKQFMGDIGLMR